MPQSEPTAGGIGQAAHLLLGLEMTPSAAPNLNALHRKVIHELKNSLASPAGFLTLLHDGAVGPLNDTQREYVRYATEGFRELETYIDDLGDVARIESGDLQLHRTSTAVGALVQRVCDKLCERVSLQDRLVAIDVAPGLPEIAADARQLGRAIAHLVVNALKATPPEGGRINVVVDLGPASDVVVTVIDQGPGVPSDQRERVFDQFVQLDPATDVGLGLGLYIARAVAELHGGRIEIADAPGGGSAVTLTLPIEARAEG